jgi:hypothetical protein
MASPHAAQLAKAVTALAEASIDANRSGAEDALTAIEHRIVDIEPRRGLLLVESGRTSPPSKWSLST